MASKPLRFHPEAEEEYLVSLSWYRERSLVVVELVVYVPMAVVQRASLEGFNYLADTLMFCGAVLLLAGAMPREAENESRRLR